MAAILCWVPACREATAPPSSLPFSLVTAYRFSSLSPDDFITDFAFAGDGSLWATTFKNRIFRIVGAEFTAVAPPSAVASDQVNQIRDLFIDPQGRPWIAAGATIAVFENGGWVDRGPGDLKGLSPVAFEVAVNRAGDIAVGMGTADAGGLLVRTNGAWTVLTPSNSRLPSPLPEDIEVADDGAFWIALRTFQDKGGVARVANGQVTHTYYEQPDGLLYNWVDDIALDGMNVWIGFDVMIFNAPDIAEGGIQELDPTTGRIDTTFPNSTSLSSNRVRRLISSRSGELWFVTSIDHHPTGCSTCLAAVGVIEETGSIRVISALNSDVAPNEFFSAIREGPDGSIYVARASRNEIAKVVR